MFEKLLRQDDTESVVERTLRVFLGSLSAMSVAFDVADGYAPHGRPQIERSPGDGRVTRADLEAAAGGDVPADADVGVARPVDPDLDADPGDPTAAAREWARQFAAGAAHLAEVREAQALIGRQEARRAQALAAFARSRPSSLDRPDAEVGAAAAESRAARPTALAAVSEWVVDEVAVALGITGGAATGLLAESLQLVSALPGTLAALSAGELTWTHVRVMTDLVAPLPDDVRAEAEARLLSRVAGKTAPQLRVAARRVVARLDAEAVRRRVADAVRDRRVSLYPGEDGMATLSAVLPLPVARAVQPPRRPGTSGRRRSGWPTAWSTWCCGPARTAWRPCRHD